MVSELRFETKKIRMADLGKESCVPVQLFLKIP